MSWNRHSHLRLEGWHPSHPSPDPNLGPDGCRHPCRGPHLPGRLARWSRHRLVPYLASSRLPPRARPCHRLPDPPPLPVGQTPRVRTHPQRPRKPPGAPKATPHADAKACAYEVRYLAYLQSIRPALRRQTTTETTTLGAADCELREWLSHPRPRNHGAPSSPRHGLSSPAHCWYKCLCPTSNPAMLACSTPT